MNWGGGMIMVSKIMLTREGVDKNVVVCLFSLSAIILELRII